MLLIIMGKRTTAQVDSGAGMLLMSWSLYKELKLIEYLEGDDFVRMANGDTIQ